MVPVPQESSKILIKFVNNVLPESTHRRVQKNVLIASQDTTRTQVPRRALLAPKDQRQVRDLEVANLAPLVVPHPVLRLQSASPAQQVNMLGLMVYLNAIIVLLVSIVQKVRATVSHVTLASLLLLRLD